MIKKIKNNTWKNIISTVTRSNNIATIVTSESHGFIVNDEITVSCNDSTFNVLEIKILNIGSSTQFSYLNSGSEVSEKFETGYIGVNKVWVGQLIKPNEYYEIEPILQNEWITDITLLTDIQNNIVVVNDGNQDFTDAVEGKAYFLAKQAFGSSMIQNSSEGLSSTTNTSYQQKLSLSTGQIPAGDYYIMWSAEVATAWIRVQINDTTIAETYTSVENDPSYMTGFKFYNSVSAGTHTIDIDYKAKSRKTAYIRRARIIIWRVE